MKALVASMDHEVETTIAFMETKSNLTSNTWYVDSALSSHLTGHREWFITFPALPANCWPIKGISSTLIYAAGLGNIATDCLFNDQWHPSYMECVLYVPGLDNNLFSITRATQKNQRY